MGPLGGDSEAGQKDAANEIPSSSGSSSLGSSLIECVSTVCPRAFYELWRRVKLEVIVEWPLLKQRWKVILFGLVMQYVHGIFTQLAHRMHQPQAEPLHDVGFDLTPELGPDKHWVSETIFGIAFAAFVIWTFSPFFAQRKRFYTAVMWSRLLMVLVVCQALRIVTFSVTQLPGPSFHCRANEPTSRRPWPEHWTGHLYVDVGRQVSKSCGDLIFSSHTIFLLTGVLTYNEYGSRPFLKGLAWLLAVVISFLIVASRKHYTVDVVIAWYTVPLVFYTLYRRWTTRRPLSEMLSDSSELDDLSLDELDGSMELEEVFIDRGNATDKMGMPVSSRTGTIKIYAKVPSDVLGGKGLGDQDLNTGSGASGKGGLNGGGGSVAMVRPRSNMVIAESTDRLGSMGVGGNGHDDNGHNDASGVMQRNTAACRVS